MCKTYDEMIIKWAGRNSRQRRGSTKVSLVTCRAAGRVLDTQRSLTPTTLIFPPTIVGFIYFKTGKTGRNYFNFRKKNVLLFEKIILENPENLEKLL